ncbi:MAG TPA: DUF3618 domain-containing protein [Streptosporangiaceae bacterium]|nr:DUF3618 domain-containing protein [Streptosporangiaceae bacterium]
MADADGAVAIRDPDALVQEIERTREDLARTIGEITERASPRNVMARLQERARAEAQRPEVRMAGAAVAGLVALGAAVFVIRRIRR